MNVVTYDGVEERKEDCVFIRGKYYHKTKHCFFYNGIYYSPFSRYLVLDHETGKRVHISAADVSFGVVGLEDNKFVFGHFSSNISNNGQIFLPKSISDAEIEHIRANEMDRGSFAGIASSRSRRSEQYDPVFDEPAPLIFGSSRSVSRIFKCMNVWPFLNNKYLSSLSSDCIALKEDVAAYNKANGNPNFMSISAANQYAFNLAYNSETMMDLFMKSYKNSECDPNRMKMVEKLSKNIEDYTFGIEYETWDGRIPTYIAANNGLIPLRDGSLRHDGICGYEYASVIMSGAKGLLKIIDQCEVLKKHAVFNEKCSMHIHVGNIPRSEENLVKLYTGFFTIQDSIYSLFPPCLRNTSAYKQKDYCSPLPLLSPITKDSVVVFLSDQTEKFRAFGGPHPKDRSAQHKWNINSRYSIFNLNNFYYTDRGTIECRISTPTFNSSKVIALLLINILIIKNALNGVYYSKVEELVENSEMSADLKEWMKSYIKYRKDVLANFSVESGRVIYYETIERDDEIGTSGPIFFQQ